MKSLAWCTLVPALALALSCGGASAPAAMHAAATLPGAAASAAAGPASFRDKAPPPGALAAPVYPKPEIRDLPNGIKLVTYQMHELPVVRMTMVGFAPRTGVATVRWKLAERITAKHSVQALAGAWQSMGAEHGAFVGDDAAGLSAKVMAKDVEAAASLLLEEWLQPSHDAGELGRLKAELIDGVKNERADLKSVARNLVRVSLERYTRADSGTEATYAAVTLSDVIEDAKLLKLDVVSQPKVAGVACPTVVLVAGDISPSSVQRQFEAVRCPQLLGGTGGGFGARRDAGVWRMSARKGATQVHVYLAHASAPFGTDDDRAAFWMMTEILGGGFSSRVNMNLREKHAFTYGAYARYRPFASNGLFSVGGPIKADKAGEAYEQIRAEITRMQTEIVSDDEMRRAKDSWLRTLSARYETADDIVGAWLQDMVTRDASDEGSAFNSEAERFTRALESVTKEQVLAMAKKYLDLSRLDLVTVGDPDSIKSEFAPFKLGEPQPYDELGAPLNAASDKAPATAKTTKIAKPTK